MSETRAQYGEAGAPGQVQHTPRPWEALPNGNTVRTLFVPGSNTHRGELVADLYAQGQGLPTAEREATARLIAAAPDLLAELENIANANPRQWHEETRDQFQQWAQSRARAALAKATAAPSEESQPPAEPRELVCMLCSTEYAPWFAPSELWNAAVRRSDGSDEFPFLCPTCFTRQALLKGINQAFVLSTDTEPHEREAELTHENERLREALRGMVEYRERWDMEEGHHDWCNALDGDDCTCGMDAARAALNHAAPAAQWEEG